MARVTGSLPLAKVFFMRTLLASLVVILCALTAAAQDDNILNPSRMPKGAIGKLPRTTKNNCYDAYRTLDDEVLIVQIDNSGDGQGKIVARFCIRDAGFVEKFKGLTGKPEEATTVDMPHVYKVVGTKNVGGKSLPVIVIHKKIEGKKK